MNRREKLVKRLISRPKNFTFDELSTLLAALGYTSIKTGKTSGSRRAFYNEEKNHLIRLHKPHPGNYLKMYQIDYLINELKRLGLI
jgi:hypothetical protein